ncbi:MAG: squalene--hopene cyclase [Planctomycetaceae bacterium]|nr:squalene--hopene cyclase [Planctomycetaceae bacterium]
MTTGTARTDTTPAAEGGWTGDLGDLSRAAAAGLERAVEALRGQQHAEGYWCGELEGDSILQSEYILLKWIVEQEDDPRLGRIANYLRDQQRAEDGAWVQYPGAAADLSATVKGYFALKLTGDDINAPHMAKARDLILRLGGAERCNTYTRFYLAALGQMHYDNVPVVPPEMVLLPKWFYFHLDKVSAWSRTMIMPLAIISSYRPIRQLAQPTGIMELYVNHDYLDRPRVEIDQQLISWKNLFLGTDRLLKVWQRTRILPLRGAAVRRIERWILRHTRHSDGLGAIFPPMVYIIIALRSLGYDQTNKHVQEAWAQLDRLMIDDGEKIRFQPCFSPVWDTGLATYAMTEAGHGNEDASTGRACEWLISKECRFPGDWTANVRQPVKPSGWYFEFNNAYYPDVDDTAMVAMALHCARGEEAREAAKRGVDWIFAMQNDDGGWAAFDRTNQRPILEHIPFADHNAIQDPSCPDITGRTLECLGHMGYRTDHPAVDKAIGFIRATQEPEGCWFGRWGVNYLYGTWQTVCGLKGVGVAMSDEWILKAGRWLRDVQKDDGSFGESADSYEDPTLKGAGPATASQTAWGTMALMAIFGATDPAALVGVKWLLDNQLRAADSESGDSAGSWREDWFTGTGFPRVFYLRYHLYRLYFPVMCLGRWVRMVGPGHTNANL